MRTQKLDGESAGSAPPADAGGGEPEAASEGPAAPQVMVCD